MLDEFSARPSVAIKSIDDIIIIKNVTIHINKHTFVKIVISEKFFFNERNKNIIYIMIQTKKLKRFPNYSYYFFIIIIKDSQTIIIYDIAVPILNKYNDIRTELINFIPNISFVASYISQCPSLCLFNTSNIK